MPDREDPSKSPEPEEATEAEESRVERVAGRAASTWRKDQQGALFEQSEASAQDPDAAGAVDLELAELDSLLDTPLARAWLADGFVESVDMPASTEPGVIEALPRRKPLNANAGRWQISPPLTTALSFEATVFETCKRMLVWYWGLFRFCGMVVFDFFRGQHSIEHRAIRLRETLEALGATFVKLGQQLSIRADILPYAYCAELLKLLDSVEPFDTQYAIDKIEKLTGKKVGETFAIFDPKPIGSASLACVFQAVLKNGDKVAVKVRRPNIGRTLAADLRALSWMMATGEFLSISRPGSTMDLAVELRTMLMEEIDFTREARYTTIFRDQVAKSKLDWVHVPKVYRELSGHDVMGTEYITGVFLSEILNAVDRDDQESLQQIRERGMEPTKIARRFVELFNWELMECLLFHADPHPANIICRPGNVIALIDFGSCGRFTARTRRSWQMFYHAVQKEDVSGMAEHAIAMIEPLPPIDMEAFRKDVVALYWDNLTAYKDEDAEWWEKASGMLWMKFAALGNKYRLPISLEALRLFRATFLLDSTLFRLHKDMEMDVEYERYDDSASKRARKRVQRKFAKKLRKGLSATDYLRMEDVSHQTSTLLARIQRDLDNPQHISAQAIGKAAFGVSVALKLLVVIVLAHLIAVIGLSAYRSVLGDAPLDTWGVLVEVVNNSAYQFILLVVALVVIRRVLLRVEDLDVSKG